MQEAVRTVIYNPEAPEILLIRRSKNDSTCPGMWNLPGGKIDPGETPLFAAQRETSEEIGAHFVAEEEMEPHLMPGWRTHVFVGRIIGEITLDLHESDQYSYVTLRQLPTFQIAFRHEEIIEQFFMQQAGETLYSG